MSSNNGECVVLTDELRNKLLGIVKTMAPGQKQPSQEVLQALCLACICAAGTEDVAILMRKFLAIRYGIMLDEAKGILGELRVLSVVLTDELRDRLSDNVEAMAPGRKLRDKEVLQALYLECILAGQIEDADILLVKFLAIRYGIMHDESKDLLDELKVLA